MKFNECLEKARCMGYNFVVDFIAPIDDIQIVIDRCNISGDDFVFIPDHKAIYTEDENYNLLNKYADIA